MAADFEGRVLGAGLIAGRLAGLARVAGTGAARGLTLVAADLLQRSADLAPILTGDLIRSGRVIPSRPAKDVIRRTVAYGTDHAIFTHFATYNLGPISITKPPTEDGPIGRLYLQRPYERHRERYGKFIVAEARKAMEVAVVAFGKVRGG
jgi:hypothetical protein